MYRYDKILEALKNNKSIKIDSNIPNCPMNNYICKKNTKKCEKGNSGQCEQALKIWHPIRHLIILYPHFVYPKETQNGYFLEANINLAFLLNNGIIKQTDLQTF